jgi:hypothetical protein
VADNNEDTRPQRVEIRDPERTAIWTGLAVGLGLAALVGVIVLIMRRRDDGVSGPVGNHAWNPQAVTPIPGYDNLGASGVAHHLPPFGVPYNTSQGPPPSPPVPLPQVQVPPRR